jgi:hypothetical protein
MVRLGRLLASGRSSYAIGRSPQERQQACTLAGLVPTQRYRCDVLHGMIAGRKPTSTPTPVESVPLEETS